LDEAGYEVLDEDMCYELLAETSLGRVGVNVDGRPAIFPINFALVDRQVVFSTGLGTKLTGALSGAVVAFEADWADTASHAAWSVQGCGPAILVEPGSEVEVAARVKVHAVAPVPRRFLVKIRLSYVSGRRLGGPINPEP
jgi:hypothetical protein